MLEGQVMGAWTCTYLLEVDSFPVLDDVKKMLIAHLLEGDSFFVLDDVKKMLILH